MFKYVYDRFVTGVSALSFFAAASATLLVAGCPTVNPIFPVVSGEVCVRDASQCITNLPCSENGVAHDLGEDPCNPPPRPQSCIELINTVSVFPSSSRSILIRDDKDAGHAQLTVTASSGATSFTWCVQREDPSKHPNGLGLLEFDPPLEDDGCVTTTPDSAGGLTGHVDITKVIGDPGPGNAEHVGEQVTIAVVATLEPVDDQGRPVPCDVPGGAPITLQVRRPEGPLVAVLTPVQGSAIAPGRTLTLRATISGGSPFPDDNRDCPGMASDLNPSNNGRGYCVEWSVSGTPSQLARAGVLTPDDLPGTDADGKVIAEADYQVPTNTVGNVVFTVSARDSSGNQAVSAAPVVVRSAKPLAFAEAASEQSVVAPGETVTLTATGTGGEAPYRIDYELLGSATLGTLSSTGCASRSATQACTVEYAAPGNAVGPVLVRVTLRDFVQATVSTTIALTVASREALAAAVAFDAPVIAPNARKNVTATVQGGTTPYTVCFKVAGGGSLSGGAAGCGPIEDFTICDCSAPFQVEFVAPGSFGTATVTAKVRDGVGALATAVASVNINDTGTGGGGGGGGGNVVTLTSVTANPAGLCVPIQPSTTITANASGGTNNTFVFMAGATVVPSTGNTATFTPAPGFIGMTQQTINVTVTSAGGSSASSSVTFTVRAPATCEDGDPCTNSLCQDGACLPAANASNIVTCDDGDACTTNDKCDGLGACVGGPPVSCDDANACTDDSCDSATGCTHALLVCNDGDPCTIDSCNPTTGCVYTQKQCDNGAFCDGAESCDSGTCVPGTPPCGSGPCRESDHRCVACLSAADCDDVNPCTTDVCDAGGACVHINNSDACNDGNACTQTDTCQSGVCTGSNPVVCPADQCHNPGTCDTSTGVCSAPTPKPNGTTCNDGNACMQTYTCQSGVCTGSNPVVCPADQCHNPGTCNTSTGVCSPPTPRNGTTCNDGDPCTTDDRCSGGSCTAGPPLDCDDGNVCTTDLCDGGGSCVYVNNSNTCNDGNACTHTDTCSGGVCAGTPYTCNDNNVCTDDSCDGDGTCTSTNNTAPCDDNNTCTTNDACRAGACVSSITYGLAEWHRMSECLAGPGTEAAVGCDCSDLADDSDVDLQDVAEFMLRFDGG